MSGEVYKVPRQAGAVLLEALVVTEGLSPWWLRE